jgi:hypothetical protein
MVRLILLTLTVLCIHDAPYTPNSAVLQPSTAYLTSNPKVSVTLE